MDIESIERQTQSTVLHVDKIENADEFLYIKRRYPGVRGVLIYTKKTDCTCHKFSQVEQYLPRPGKRPGTISYGSAKPWLIVDEEMPCEEFDLLMSFVLDHHILELPSQETFTSVRGGDLIGLRIKGNVEHWYAIHGCMHRRPEHEEIMAKLLSSEEGRSFEELIECEARL